MKRPIKFLIDKNYLSQDITNFCIELIKAYSSIEVVNFKSNYYNPRTGDIIIDQELSMYSNLRDYIRRHEIGHKLILESNRNIFIKMYHKLIFEIYNDYNLHICRCDKCQKLQFEMSCYQIHKTEQYNSNSTILTIFAGLLTVIRSIYIVPVIAYKKILRKIGWIRNISDV